MNLFCRVEIHMQIILVQAKLPVEVQPASQHSPVTAACAGGIQTGTNFLAYRDGQSESIRANLRRW